MTAINPARLKIQCADLSKMAVDPDRFVSGLHDLLTFYAARIRQTELTKTPLTLQSYQVPPPVLRRLQTELEEHLSENPEIGYPLADRLWKEDWVEFRKLAITTIGGLPTDQPERILNRLNNWLTSCTSDDIRQQVISGGFRRLTTEKPAAIRKFLSELIASQEKSNHQAALYGLTYLVHDPDFEDLPTVFNLLEEILLTDETGLVKEIIALIRQLRKRSEEETVFFLTRQLAKAAKPRIFRIVRGAADLFSQENSRNLRVALNNYS